MKAVKAITYVSFVVLTSLLIAMTYERVKFNMETQRTYNHTK